MYKLEYNVNKTINTHLMPMYAVLCNFTVWLVFFFSTKIHVRFQFSQNIPISKWNRKKKNQVIATMKVTCGLSCVFIFALYSFSYQFILLVGWSCCFHFYFYFILFMIWNVMQWNPSARIGLFCFEFKLYTDILSLLLTFEFF